MSIDKDFFAYKKSGENNVVYIEDLNSNLEEKIELSSESIGQFKPSPDGNYLLANIYNYSQSQIETINVNTNKRIKVMDPIFPSSLDWKN